MYKYIHTCIYIHISCLHTYTHTHIYTYAYKMYIWTHAKHVWNDGAAATVRAAQLHTKNLCPSPCPQHDSAPSRPHVLICTGAEPIHPVHCPRQLPAWPCRPMAPRNEVIFLPFWRDFQLLSTRLCQQTWRPNRVRILLWVLYCYSVTSGLIGRTLRAEWLVIVWGPRDWCHLNSPGERLWMVPEPYHVRSVLLPRVVCPRPWCPLWYVYSSVVRFENRKTDMYVLYACVSM